MTEHKVQPKKAVAPVKEAAGAAVFGVVTVAVFSAFLCIPFLIIPVVFNLVSERFLPVATREFLFWFADDILPQIAPAVNWANRFGVTWNGLLTFASFVLAVLGTILTLARYRGKNGN